MQIKTEDYTTTININLACPDCGSLQIVFDDDPKSFAETFLAAPTMAVIPWHCSDCGSGGTVHIIQSAQQSIEPTIDTSPVFVPKPCFICGQMVCNH